MYGDECEGRGCFCFRPLEVSQIPLQLRFDYPNNWALSASRPPPPWRPRLLPFIYSSWRVRRVPGHSWVRTSATPAAASLEPSSELRVPPQIIPVQEKQSTCVSSLAPLWKIRLPGYKKNEVYTNPHVVCYGNTQPQCPPPLHPPPNRRSTPGCTPRSLLVCSRLPTRGRMPPECRWIH